MFYASLFVLFSFLLCLWSLLSLLYASFFIFLSFVPVARYCQSSMPFYLFFCLCFSFETVLCLFINIVSLHSCLFIGFANALLLIKCGVFATVALIIKYSLPPLNGFFFSFANVAWFSQCDMPLFFLLIFSFLCLYLCFVNAL